MVNFHKTYKTVAYKPYAEELEQVVPEVGLVFSIDDNWARGNKDAYIVTTVDKPNSRGLPKKIWAKRLHKTENFPGKTLYMDGAYTISEDGTQCLVGDTSAEEFKFQRRNGEAYYHDRISNLFWGKTSQSYNFPT